MGQRVVGGGRVFHKGICLIGWRAGARFRVPCRRRRIPIGLSCPGSWCSRRRTRQCSSEAMAHHAGEKSVRVASRCHQSAVSPSAERRRRCGPEQPGIGDRDPDPSNSIGSPANKTPYPDGCADLPAVSAGSMVRRPTHALPSQAVDVTNLSPGTDQRRQLRPETAAAPAVSPPAASAAAGPTPRHRTGASRWGRSPDARSAPRSAPARAWPAPAPGGCPPAADR